MNRTVGGDLQREIVGILRKGGKKREEKKGRERKGREKRGREEKEEKEERKKSIEVPKGSGHCTYERGDLIQLRRLRKGSQV